VSEEDAVKCDLCDQVLVGLKNLKRHKMTHEDDGEEWFKCRHCDRGFGTATELESHEPSHGVVEGHKTSHSVVERDECTGLKSHVKSRCGRESQDKSGCGRKSQNKSRCGRKSRVKSRCGRESQDKSGCGRKSRAKSQCGRESQDKTGYGQESLAKSRCLQQSPDKSGCGQESRVKSECHGVAESDDSHERDVSSTVFSIISAHFQQHIAKPRPYSCSLCPNEYLSRRNFDKHLRTHAGRY